MMQSKASKYLSRGFQVSSEISFLISVRKVLPTSGQNVDLTTKIFLVWELNAPSLMMPLSPTEPQNFQQKSSELN